MALGLLLAALMSLPASAGEFNSACFFGINDAQTPATIGNCEASALLNTESNLDGTAIIKRRGFSKTADLTVATGPVTGSHSFIDSSGNRKDIVCQDRNCAASTNGNAFSVFYSTGSTGITRWSWVDVGGNAYGGNNRYDKIIKYDGTSTSNPVGMPLGSILEMNQDRLIIGDISGSPNRVHKSSAGAYEQFTVGVNPEDSYFDEIGAPGDRIRGIKCHEGVCDYFKTASITRCEEDNQYTTRCAVISPNLGTTDPNSIITAGSALYFRAQDKNYWEIGPQGFRQISQKIPNLVKSQSGGLGGGEQSNTQTTQADWNNGSESPANTWDTTTIPGSIFPSSVTLIDTSGPDFSLAASSINISTTDLPGSITMSSTSFGEAFSDSTYAVGPVTWTVVAGGFDIEDGALRGITAAVNQLESYQTSISSGYWSWSHKWRREPGTYAQCGGGSTQVCYQFKFMMDTAGDYYSARLANPSGQNLVQIVKNISGVDTVIASAEITYPEDGSFRDWEIIRSTAGFIHVYVDSVFYASATAGVNDIGVPVRTEVDLRRFAGSSDDEVNYFKTLYAYQYKEPGTLTSRIFDSGFSTVVAGPFSSTFTVQNNIEGQVNFYVRNSTSPNNDMWSSFAASSDTLRTSLTERYQQYKVDIYTFVSTKTPSVQEISLANAATGFYTTQCIQPNSSIASWGTLSCAESLAGNGSIVYYATSAATCANLPSTDPGSWQTIITNNATVTIATNTAVKIGWKSLLTSSTDQAQIDACTLAWNEGAPSQPSWAVYDSIKNAIYWTATINGAASSNRLLKYDRNLDHWYPFDIPAQAPKMINNSLYFGGASSGTWNQYGIVDADAGNGINAYWQSKDMGSDSPFLEKKFGNLSILSRNNQAGSMTATWTNSIGATGTYSISLSTGPGSNYARSNYQLPKKSAQQFMNVRVGNTNSTPFEVLGIGLTWAVEPWKVAP